MRPSPLLSGTLYIVLGIIFTVIAIQNVNMNGEWGILTYLLILVATFDLGNGIKLILLHYRIKNIQNQQKDNS